MASARALQQEFIEEKVVALADHLHTRVLNDGRLQAEEIADALWKRLEPELSSLAERLETIERLLDGHDIRWPEHIVRLESKLDDMHNELTDMQWLANELYAALERERERKRRSDDERWCPDTFSP